MTRKNEKYSPAGYIAFDQRASLLYMTVHQKFTLWFIPFNLWQANVKLLTVLELAALPVDEDNHPRRAITTTDHSGSSSSSSTNHNDGDNNHNNYDHYDTSAQPRTRFFIRGQEDHYQIEEWLKFIAPWGASMLWVAWQLFATCICAFGVLLWPFGLVRAVNRRRQAYKLKQKERERLRSREGERGTQGKERESEEGDKRD